VYQNLQAGLEPPLNPVAGNAAGVISSPVTNRFSFLSLLCRAPGCHPNLCFRFCFLSFHFASQFKLFLVLHFSNARYHFLFNFLKYEMFMFDFNNIVVVVFFVLFFLRLKEGP
jgi:hypothetical protein